MDLQIFKGRWGGEKEGEESGIQNNPPRTSILRSVCFLINSYIILEDGIEPKT